MKFKVIFASILFIILFFSFVSAEVPKMINYQGKITTPQGALIDTTVSMVFTIYDDSTGGTVLWRDSLPLVVIEKGVFSVLLGSVNEIPDSVFDGNVRYLGINVGDDPEMTPRKAIVSVGYAFHSGTADTAKYTEPDADWVIDGDDIYHEEGNVGIGTTSAGAALEIRRDVDGAQLHIGRADTPDKYLSIYNGGAHPVIDAINPGYNTLQIAKDGVVQVTVTTSGNVGIGTTSPSERLDVNGTIKVDTGGAIKFEAGDFDPYFKDDWGVRYHGDLSHPFQLESSALLVGYTAGGGNYSLGDLLVSGNVGIGTTSPTSLLHLKGVTSVPTLTFEDNFTPLGGIQRIKVVGGVGGYLSISADVGEAFNVRRTTGNVGIGTTSPAYKLDVAGDIRSTGTIYGNFAGTIDNADKVDGYHYSSSWPTTLGNIQSACSNDFHNIGGTDDDVPDNDAEVPDNISINNDRLYAPSGSGNVGIGTTSPTRTLVVAGDGDFTGSDPAEQVRVENWSNETNADGIFARTHSLHGGAGLSADATEMSDGDTYGVLGVTRARSTRANPSDPNKSSGSAAGVYGWAAYTENTGDVFGVLGVCDGIGGSGPGPNAAAGVYGLCTKDTGKNYGVFGETKSKNTDVAGVYGIGNNTDGRVHGVLGLTQSDEEGSAGVFGVAQANTGITYGVYGRSNSSSGYGGYFDGGLKCINGDITVENGNKLAVVPTSQGMIGLYSQESPEVWFEDFGESELKNGKAHIEIDPLFLETVTINGKHPMKVFIQLNDDCNGVFVKRGNTGFEVVELNNGKSDARFTYRVVAKRKGFEDKRLEKTKIELASE